MTIGEIVERVTTTVQDISDEMKDVVKKWILDCKRDMARIHKFTCLLGTYELTANGKQDYDLPEYIDTVLRVSCGETIIPNFDSNVANSIMCMKYRGKVLSSPSVLTFTGTAGDTGTVSVFDNNGEFERITLNGATPVATTKIFSKIMHIYKEATAAPLVWGAGAETFTSLAAAAGSRIFSHLHFNAVIASGTYLIEYIKPLTVLDNDNDLDEMQIAYPTAIMEYCTSRAYRQQDNQGKEIFHWQTYQEELKKAIREDCIEKNRRSSLHLVGQRW